MSTSARLRLVLSLLAPPVLSLVAIAGCDSSTPMMGNDAGAPMPDAGRDAGPPPPPYSCEEAHVVMGALGSTQTERYDTSMTMTRPRDLGLTCGNVEAEVRWAGQEVIEYHVPGTADQVIGVDVSTATMGTEDAFDTILQFRTDCESVPTVAFPPTCFDNTSSDIHARGGFEARGGDTVYIVVTGFSDPPAAAGTVDEGMVQVDITATLNTAPTLDAATVSIPTAVRTTVSAMGMDAEMNARGALIRLYQGDTLIDIDGGGADPNSDFFAIDFDSVTGNYAGTAASSPNPDGSGLFLAYALRASGATQVGVEVYDVAYATSDEVRVPIDDAASAAACGSAAPVTLTDPGAGMPQTGTVMGNLVGPVSSIDDFGLMWGSCAAGQAGFGREAIHSVTVPAGAWDLVATTNVAASGSTDTILYMRSACASAATELGCQDDINYAGGEYQSEVRVMNIAPGTYYLFVEQFQGGMGTAPYGLSVTLTPRT